MKFRAGIGEIIDMESVIMTLEQINLKLEELKAQRIGGLETDLYTRIVGHYRSMRSWNRSRMEEYGIYRGETTPPSADSIW